MKELKTIEDAIDFAIGREQDAVDFYNALAKKSTNEKSRDILLGFAEEEASHHKKLEAVKRNADTLPPLTGASIFVVENPTQRIRIGPDMTFEEALVLAISLEKKAVSLYLDMSQASTDPSLKIFFKQLAFEEKAHDDQFEIIYNEECGIQKIKEQPKVEREKPKPKQPEFITLVEESNITIEASPTTMSRPQV